MIQKDIANVGTRFILASVRYNSLTDEKFRILLYNHNTTESATVNADHSLKPQSAEINGPSDQKDQNI